MISNDLIKQVNNDLKVIISQSSLEEFSTLKLIKGNEISRIIDFFGYFNINLPSGISEEQKIDLLLDKLTEFMTSPENKEYIAQLEKLSGMFSIEINNGLSTLSNTIKPLVEDIYEKITERFEILLKRENAENLISDMAIPDTDRFDFLKWNGLSSAIINDENIVDLVTNLVNISNKEINSMNVNIAIGKVIRPGYKEIDSKAVLKNNEDVISEYFNKNYKNINTEDAKRYFSISTDKNEYFKFFNGYIKKSLEDIKSISTNIQKIIFDCNALLDFIDAIKKFVTLNVSDLTKNNIYTNLNLVKESCYIVLFYCLYVKKEIFKGKLIISKTLINFPEYLKIEKEGLDLVYIANYLKAYYKDKPIPVLGISTKDILESKDKVKDDIEKINAQILLNKNIIFNGCLFKAVKHVLGNSFEYIVDTLGFDFDPMDQIKANYHQALSTRLNRLNGDLGRVEDAIYDIIMNIFFKSTLIYNIYILINKNYIHMLSENKVIGNKDITNYTAKSIIDLMCEFFKDNYIE